MNILHKLTSAISWRVSQLAQLALFLTMLLIVINAFTRRIWIPLPGTVEMVELLGAVILGLGVAYCQFHKGHIFVNLLVKKFPLRLQALTDIFTNTLALTFTSFLSWQLIQYAGRMMERGYVTGHLEIPVWPFIYLVGLGFIILALVLIRDIMKAVFVLLKGSEKT